jgi:fluoroquinolone transport system ATP-binding protein
MVADAPSILSAEQLRYSYPGAREPVLCGLDFEIRPGEIFGFLGPNGSGKTTTQKLLARILLGYQGSVQVFGGDLERTDAGFYNRVGVCFEFPNLYEKLTAEENLEFYRRFFDVETERPREVLARMDLPVGDHRHVSQWSKGMKMRLVLARSLLNRPQLWFLDEPTTGQDPQHAVMIRKLIRRRADEGATVFLTTHNMTVADELCDRVAFLNNGEIAVIDTPRALKLAHASKLARIEYRSGDRLESAEIAIDDAAGRERLAELIKSHPVETIHTQEPTLEDVFIRVTGAELS